MARNLVRFNPFAELDELQRQFFEGGFPLRMRGVRTPTIDVYTEEDNRLTVEAHLPDFDENDVNVSLDEGALVIQADKHEKSEDDKKKNYVVRESSTSYYRRIILPDQADQEKIEAKFARGVLKVTVPFKALPQPKKIEITSDSGQTEAPSDVPPEQAPSGVSQEG